MGKQKQSESPRSGTSVKKGPSDQSARDPVFLMCPPFAYGDLDPMNPWMEDLEEERIVIDRSRAMRQFRRLYSLLAQHAFIDLLPPDPLLRTQVFAANLGFASAPGGDVVALANIPEGPRSAEPAKGRAFLAALGYETAASPHPFNGGADVKRLNGAVHVVGYGHGTGRATVDWLRERLEIDAIPVELVDPYLSSLHDVVLPLGPSETIVCTEVLTPEEIAALEKHANIIDIPVESAYAGLCGSLVIEGHLLNASDPDNYEKGSDDLEDELAKNRLLESICAKRKLEPIYVELGEFTKTGALLTSLVMPLPNPRFPQPGCRL